MEKNVRDDERPRTSQSDTYGYEDGWGPTRTEVDEWAQREHERRQKWVNGPSEEERRAWARYERRRRMAETDQLQRDRRFREAELAREGFWSIVTSSPMEVWDRLVDAGREFEDRRPLRRSRVPLRDDDL